MTLLVVLTGIAAALCAVMAAYLLFLTLAACVAAGRKRRAGKGETRFAVVIPAHNESLNIESVVRGIGERVAYRRSLYDVIVVADNCSDDTAALARRAGADVIERFDDREKGKGYALDHAFAILLEREVHYDAFVVLDADSLVSENFLSEMDAALAGGADAIQGHYDVLNPDDSWRTSLMFAALSAIHLLRPLGRSLLGLSVGLKGNGMCFSRAIVERFGWNAYSVVEDMEYGFRLALHGIPVRFARGAKVWAQMAAGAKESTTQRVRWEGGRRAMVAEWIPPLAKHALRNRSLVSLDLAVDLLVPPLTLMVASTLLVSALGFGLALSGGAGAWLAFLCGGTLSAIALYVLTGLVLNRAPAHVYRALLLAPVFVAWKLWLNVKMATGKGQDDWVRTGRTRIESPARASDAADRVNKATHAADDATRAASNATRAPSNVKGATSNVKGSANDATGAADADGTPVEKAASS